MCPLVVLCCVCGVLGHLAPVHRCAHLVCCVACAVSWATWLLFSGVPARRVVLRVRCPGPLGSCSPVCPLGVLCCMCGVLGHLAPLLRSARSVCCFACAVSWATWLLFTGVPPRCVGCVYGVLGDLAPAQRRARSVRCFACAVSWATWLLFPGVPARCVALRVRCPGPLGSCSPVCLLGALPVCAVFWATWLLFTGVPARYVVLRVRCPEPLGSCSPVCPLGVLFCLCGVLGHLAPVQQCARSSCCVACVVSWATWLLFTGVPTWCVVLHVRCPGPLDSFSPVCPLGVLCCLCGVLGHLAPVHRCAHLVCCVACAVSWATWLLCSDVPAVCAVWRVRCPGPHGSCSPVCPLGALLCVCRVLGHLAPVHRCACLVCCLCVQCPGPFGFCSPVCPLGVLFCLCGVLGHLAPVHRCARSVCCFACAVSWATWLLFTGVPARCVGCVCGVLGDLAPAQRRARSVRCFACAVSWATWLLFTGVPARCVGWVCGVLGDLAPVHRRACSACCFACAVSWATWLLFTGVPARCVVLLVRFPGPLGSCSPMCPLVVLCCVCVVLGHLAPVHRCARLVRCFACAVSWAPWLLFTGVPALCVVLLVRCRGPIGSISPVCPLCPLLCVCGVLGHRSPVHRCACLVCCFSCAVSWATWLLFTGVPARCVALLVRCPGPLGSCSPLCPLGALLCVCGDLGHLAPVHRCARSVRCLCVRCPGPLGSCSPACPLGVLFFLCGVLSHLAPVHRLARSVCCFAFAVSWATWLLFTDVPARRVVLRVRCPGPLGSCSPVCPLGVSCCMCGVLGHLAPVLRCARSACCVACAVSWATWLLFTGVPTWCVVLHVRCPGPLGSCAPMCPLCVLCGVCGVLGHLAPVHRCARSVRCFACAVSWATWLLFTGVPARCVVLLGRCPGPLGSCSPVCPLGVLFCLCGVLGHLALVHRCARSVRCFVCAVSWATLLLFPGVPAWCVVLLVRCPGPPGSCSPVCPIGALLCLCAVLGHLAPVHRCARSLRCFACAVSWSTWLLFTGVAPSVRCLCVRCSGPLGSCSAACPVGVLFCVCGVLSHLAPVHRLARSVCCFACAVSWATWLLFSNVPTRRVVLRVRCPGPLGSCSPVCPLGMLCCMCGVLGHLAPVLWCARSACCVACAVSWATWLLFTGVPTWCVVLHVRCPGPLGSSAPVCPLGVLFCLCGVLGYLAPVHRCAPSVRWMCVRCPWRLGSCPTACPLGALLCVCGVLGHLAPVPRCARSVRCFACAVSWATWLLFTGVPGRCVACVCGVLGHLAPVHRRARSACCFACAVS